MPGRRQRSIDTPVARYPDMAGYTEARTVVTPSRFYGRLGDDVETFLKEFDRAARANRWTDERKAEILPAYLREFAADFWNDLNDHTKYDYDQVTAALRENFLPKETQRLFYNELYNRKQKPGEPVEEFARIIQRLTLRAHMDMPREFQSELMREHFIRGLRSSLKRMVMSKDPVTFEEAVRVAKAEECNEELVNGKGDVSLFSTLDPFNAKSASQEDKTVAAVQPPTSDNIMQSMLETLMKRMETMIDEKMEKFNAPLEKNSDSADKAAPANRTTSRDRRSSRNRGAPGRNQRTTDGLPICNICHRVGHVQRHCPDRQNQRQQPQMSQQMQPTAGYPFVQPQKPASFNPPTWFPPQQQQQASQFQPRQQQNSSN
ncbi:uncharacterized protein [Ptychodera flava]|uniref:uncharacterized protein n=1 Tax=Ptychodera flava TaxID=63121 RepID=UPI00396A7C36